MTYRNLYIRLLQDLKHAKAIARTCKPKPQVVQAPVNNPAPAQKPVSDCFPVSTVAISQFTDSACIHVRGASLYIFA